MPATDAPALPLATVPRFLDLAAGFKPGDPVVVSFYGGKGSRHVRWRPEQDGGGALAVPWDDAIQEEVARRLPEELEQGRQLGFIAAQGGSKKEQITHVFGLRAEIDLPDSRAMQLKLFGAVEARYGIRFTLLDTGGKSIHAWIAATKKIPADQYRATSKLWHQRIQEVAKDAQIDLPEGALDEACHRPTQVMRLPGSIHLKTGKVAQVIQWGGGPVALEQLGLAWPVVEEWAKSTSAPRAAAQMVIAKTCRQGQFLGRTGDERIDELVSLARAVPVRVPGAGTYGTVLPLVSALSRALGAQEAAEVLHRAGHLDKQGKASLEGLRAWCDTFAPDPEGASERLAFLAAWAEREHGWRRPNVELSGVLKPTQLVDPSPAAICDALWGGRGLVVCPTGTGKTEGACAYIERMDAAMPSLPVAVITPRRTINAQVAKKLKAVNVSGVRSGMGDPYSLPETIADRYVCCLPSLGSPSKLNGDQAYWGEFWIKGYNGSPPVLIGRGVMVTVLMLDEVRQQITDLLLSPCGPGSIWETPAHRWRAGVSLVRSISHAGRVIAMDAQAGEPERELLRLIGRIEADAVLGCPPEVPSRTMRWTSEQTRWRDCLLGHVKDRGGKGRPLLVVTGAKGKDGEGRRGLSARALRDAVREVEPASQVLIIDAESKDTDQARRALRGDVEGLDVVICTPVAQSGVNWVEVFSETVFVAGGRTLPPNICGGQAGRRERTATTCVAYFPKTVWDRSLPVLGREEDEIRAELDQVRHQAEGLNIARGWEIEILEQIYVLAAKRQIQELALFRDYTLHYAQVDGWATEELAAVRPLPRAKDKGQEKRTEPLAYSELHPWRELLVRSLKLQAAGADREVRETQEAALRETQEAMVGSAGGDLLSANLAEVQGLLLEAGVGRLCDGRHRDGDDPLVVEVAQALKTPKAAAIMRKAVWLGLDLKGGDTRPARTIGTVVRSLGGISDSRKMGPSGGQRQVYRWVLPGER